MELNQEHFDEQLKRLVTKDDVTQHLAGQTEELKAYAGEQTDGLAAMVNEGFEDIHRRLDVW